MHAQLALTDFLDTWISTDRHHPSARRQRPRSLNGRSDTPGAVAAAAQPPQTTIAVTLRQHRSHLRRFCCLAGCLISGRRGSDARAATTLQASPMKLAATLSR